MSKITIRNAILAVILLAVSAGATVYMVFELNAKNILLREQMVALQTKQAQENSFFKMQRVHEESTADREALAKYFFKQESDSIDFLNMVEGLAPKAGVTLKTEGLEQQEDKKAKKTWVLIDFVFSGSYEKVTDFVTILENLPYEAEITSVSLAVEPGSNWVARTTMKINVYTYDEK